MSRGIKTEIQVPQIAIYIHLEHDSILRCLLSQKVRAYLPIRRYSVGTSLDASPGPAASRSKLMTWPARPKPVLRIETLSPVSITNQVHFLYPKERKQDNQKVKQENRNTFSGRVIVIVSMTVIGAILPSESFL